MKKKIKENMIEFTNKQEVDLVAFVGGDNQVALSAWVSFGNDDKSRLFDTERVNGLINFLYRNDHLTPFESSTFTFGIETPIFAAREFMRHRSASYNEMSGRYTELKPKFYLPDANRPLTQVGKAGNYSFIQGSDEQRRIVQECTKASVQESWNYYQAMLGAGVAKEVARNVLPVNIYTRFYVTMNARNLMHFLNLRTAPNALQEIREVAWLMEESFAEKMPMTYEAWKKKNGK